MANPTSRHQLKEYCLRRLGKGVIEINVSDESLEDRIDEALNFFQEYHFDGVNTVYYKRKITASKITFTVPNVSVFQSGEKITGLTSGATATFIDKDSGNTFIRVKGVTGSFADGETIRGNLSLSTGVIATNGFLLGDFDNRSIPVPADTLGVEQIIPAGGLLSGLFGNRYQSTMDYLRVFVRGELVSYFMASQHVSLLRDLFQGSIRFRHNRKTNTLFLDADWDQILPIDEFVVVELYQAIDPQTHKEVYSDEFLLDYTTELFRRQWGENLSKYKDLQLPGGVTLDGAGILTTATTELERLRQLAKDRFIPPIPLLFG